MQEAPTRGKAWLKRLVRGAIGLVVLVAVARHVVRTWGELKARGGLPRVEWAWMGLAVVLYLAGLCGFGLFFVRVLDSGPTPAGAFVGLRAYLISHTGKYVPGKAMVVVMRVGMVTSRGVRASAAAFATLYETLMMMAVGGLVASIGFGLRPSRIAIAGWEVPMILPALAAGLGFASLLHPRVFSRLALLAGMPFPGVGPGDLPRYSRRLETEGEILSLAGWTLLGLSQVAVIRAITPAGLPRSAWPAAVASVALATIAGFVVAVAPGGLGVREWVLWTSLGSVLDRDLAVVASLGLRLAWLAGEVGTAGALLLIRPARKPVGVAEP